MKRLGREFFERETGVVARELLGKRLVVVSGGVKKTGIVSETEAYLGEEDKASHARFGVTKRNSVMWEKGGLVYVYLIYGMYWCLNVVAGWKGRAGAVLIRGVVPVENIDGKTDGPGKLTREFGIDKSIHGEDVVRSKRIWFEEGKVPGKIIATPRVGVGYAGEWRNKKLRFLLGTGR